ncbi:hypothetical protein [Blautia producta]|uniref:hypothetical protein n=1 Tax=Blautia producta TaxID=33035 RepID=UPI0035666371
MKQNVPKLMRYKALAMLNQVNDFDTKSALAEINEIKQKISVVKTEVPSSFQHYDFDRGRDVSMFYKFLYQGKIEKAYCALYTFIHGRPGNHQINFPNELTGVLLSMIDDFLKMAEQ